MFFLQEDKAIKKLIFAFSWKTLLAIPTLYPQSFTYTLSILTTKNFTVVQIFLNKTAVLRLKLKLWMIQVDCKLLTFENLKSCFHCTSEQWEIIGVSPIIQTCPGKQYLSHEQLTFSSHTGQVTPTNNTKLSTRLQFTKKEAERSTKYPSDLPWIFRYNLLSIKLSYSNETTHIF